MRSSCNTTGTEEECCLSDKGCGKTQADVCNGKGWMSDPQYQEMISMVRTMVYLGAALIIIGQLPPLLSAYGKLKDIKALESCCGCLGCPSTLIFGAAGGGGIAVYLLYVVYLLPMFNINSWCAAYQLLMDEYASVGPSCNGECLAVMQHEGDVLCGLTNGIGATAFLVLVSALCGMGTMFLVCVGCCNRKKKVQQVQGVMVVQGGQQPVLGQVVVVPTVQLTQVEEGANWVKNKEQADANQL